MSFLDPPIESIFPPSIGSASLPPSVASESVSSFQLLSPYYHPFTEQVPRQKHHHQNISNIQSRASNSISDSHPKPTSRPDQQPKGEHITSAVDDSLVLVKKYDLDNLLTPRQPLLIAKEYVRNIV